jgi:hypothetical protein
MPMDESGNLVDQVPSNTRSVDIDSEPPPAYNNHVRDQPYVGQHELRSPEAQLGVDALISYQPQSGLEANLDGILGSNDAASQQTTEWNHPGQGMTC